MYCIQINTCIFICILVSIHINIHLYDICPHMVSYGICYVVKQENKCVGVKLKLYLSREAMGGINIKNNI
jgi:hypothetical protein